MIKEYETTVSKIIYYDKNKKNEFLEDFREISVVDSLKYFGWNVGLMLNPQW